MIVEGAADETPTLKALDVAPSPQPSLGTAEVTALEEPTATDVVKPTEDVSVVGCATGVESVTVVGPSLGTAVATVVG